MTAHEVQAELLDVLLADATAPGEVIVVTPSELVTCLTLIHHEHRRRFGEVRPEAVAPRLVLMLRDRGCIRPAGGQS